MLNQHSSCPKCDSRNLSVYKQKKKRVLSLIIIALAWIGFLLFSIGLIFVILVPDDQPIIHQLSNDDLGYIALVVGGILVLPFLKHKQETRLIKKYKCIDCEYTWSK